MNKKVILGTILLIILTGFGVVLIREMTKDQGQLVSDNTDTQQISTIPQLTQVPSDWKEYHNSKFLYSIKYPASFEVQQNGENSILVLNPTVQSPVGNTNFAYISVINPADKSKSGEIYNYDHSGHVLLNNAFVGESVYLTEEPGLKEFFSYERLPDVQIHGKTAKIFVNTKPWEFPAGTTEYRYIIDHENTIFLIGGYFSNQSSFNKEVLSQILATFSIGQ